MQVSVVHLSVKHLKRRITVRVRAHLLRRRPRARLKKRSPIAGKDPFVHGERLVHCSFEPTARAPVSPSVRASLIARHRSCVHPRTERVVRVASVPRAQNLSLARRPSRRDRSPSPRTILLAKVSVKTCDKLFHALSRARARHVARRASLGDVPTSATDRLEKPSAAGSCS